MAKQDDKKKAVQKDSIHPDVHPVIFRDFSANYDLKTTSTMTSEKVEKHDGVEYYIIDVEISSASHPFYTGKEKLVDTAGRVDKFKQKEVAIGERKKKKRK